MQVSTPPPSQSSPVFQVYVEYNDDLYSSTGLVDRTGNDNVNGVGLVGDMDRNVASIVAGYGARYLYGATCDDEDEDEDEDEDVVGGVIIDSVGVVGVGGMQEAEDEGEDEAEEEEEASAEAQEEEEEEEEEEEQGEGEGEEEDEDEDEAEDEGEGEGDAEAEAEAADESEDEDEGENESSAQAEAEDEAEGEDEDEYEGVDEVGVDDSENSMPVQRENDEIVGCESNICDRMLSPPVAKIFERARQGSFVGAVSVGGGSGGLRGWCDGDRQREENINEVAKLDSSEFDMEDLEDDVDDENMLRHAAMGGTTQSVEDMAKIGDEMMHFNGAEDPSHFPGVMGETESVVGGGSTGMLSVARVDSLNDTVQTSGVHGALLATRRVENTRGMSILGLSTESNARHCSCARIFSVFSNHASPTSPICKKASAPITRIRPLSGDSAPLGVINTAATRGGNEIHFRGA